MPPSTEELNTEGHGHASRTFTPFQPVLRDTGEGQVARMREANPLNPAGVARRTQTDRPTSRLKTFKT